MPSARQVVFLGVTGSFFVLAGVLHFLRTEPYLKIVPPYVPWHRAMVYVSGVAEIAGGIGILIRSLRRAAGWGLVALLLAVFPANVYMATNDIQPMSFHIPETFLWIRLPLQALLIWWVLSITQRD